MAFGPMFPLAVPFVAALVAAAPATAPAPEAAPWSAAVIEIEVVLKGFGEGNVLTLWVDPHEDDVYPAAVRQGVHDRVTEADREKLNARLAARRELAATRGEHLESHYPGAQLTTSHGGSLIPFSWRTEPAGGAGAGADAAAGACPPTSTLSDAELIDHVRHSIVSARMGMSKLSVSDRGGAVMAVDGMSSSDVRHLLNNLGSAPGTRYLEVGVYKGSTMASVVTANEEEVDVAVGIDLWGTYASFMATGSEENSGVVKGEAHKNLKAVSEVATEIPLHIQLVQADCFTQVEVGADEWRVRGVPMPSPGPFNLYLYDGAHEHEDQAKAFYHYDSQLTDVFIAVIDDWNHFPVQTGTAEAFETLGYEVLEGHVLGSGRAGDSEKGAWHNGLYVAVVRKTNGMTG